MVGPKLFHIHQTRSFPAGFRDPASIMSAMNSWLHKSGFHVRSKGPYFARGRKHGVHVNFIPKFKLAIQVINGHYHVMFDYFAKAKLGTAVVLGVLTSGLSTVVGLGTFAARLAEADDLVHHFWKHAESLALGPPVVVKMERWVTDSNGNYVHQPVTGTVAVAAVPVAVAAVPVGYPPAHAPAPSGKGSSSSAYPGNAAGYPGAPQQSPYAQGGYQPAPYGQPSYPPQGYAQPYQPQGYPPQQGGYPPQQGGYPPQQGGYPPQQSGYPPQQGYFQQGPMPSYVPPVDQGPAGPLPPNYGVPAPNNNNNNAPHLYPTQI